MMRNHCFIRLGAFAVAGALGLGLVLSAQAYQRRVLFEDFTSTTCPPCAQFAPALEQALHDVGDLAVPIAVHVYWPAPGNDPWWLDNQNDNQARISYYGVNAVPWLNVDGTHIAIDANAVRSNIRNRANVDSPLEMTLEGHWIENELQVDVSVTSSSNLNNLRLFVALKENYWNYRGPNGLADHYHAMVAMIPNGNGTAFDIQSQQTREFHFAYDMTNAGWHELQADNLKLAAWVQAANREVLQATDYQMGYESPYITVVGWGVQDNISGNNDGRAEPGETAALILTLRNAPNYLAAENIRVEMTTRDAGIQVIEGVVEVSRLESGQETVLSDQPLTFQVADDFIAHPVTFALNITAEPGGFGVQNTVTFMVGWPPILVVDAMNDRQAADAVMGLFGANDLPWADRFDHTNDVVSYDLLAHYRMVFWHTFNNESEIISEWDQEELAGYLDDGGVLVMSGAFLATALDGTEFMSRYLGADLDNSDINYSYVTGYADSRTFAGTRLLLIRTGESLGFPAIKSSIRPVGGAARAMFWDNNGSDAGTAAVENVTDRFATLFLSFPPECISGASRTVGRVQFTQTIYNWALSHVQAVGPVGGSAPVTFMLHPARPNPFNSRMLVDVDLTAGYATLALFDLTGRHIVDLFSGVAPAGRRTLAVDASGLGLSDGVYYLRLTSGGRVAQQKVVLLK